jgi:hypothetical protein
MHASLWLRCYTRCACTACDGGANLVRCSSLVLQSKSVLSCSIKPAANACMAASAHVEMHGTTIRRVLHLLMTKKVHAHAGAQAMPAVSQTHSTRTQHAQQIQLVRHSLTVYSRRVLLMMVRQTNCLCDDVTSSLLPAILTKMQQETLSTRFCPTNTFLLAPW